jgi:hypothetical protein
VEFFRRAAEMEWKQRLIAAFGSTCHASNRARRRCQHPGAARRAHPGLHGLWQNLDLHVTDVLRTTWKKTCA